MTLQPLQIVGFSTKRIAYACTSCWRSSPDSQWADVISIDTANRAVSTSEVYRIVRDAAIRIRMDSYVNIYKSLDSTLRGNLGVEIDRVLDVFGFELTVVSLLFHSIGEQQ